MRVVCKVEKKTRNAFLWHYSTLESSLSRRFLAQLWSVQVCPLICFITFSEEVFDPSSRCRVTFVMPVMTKLESNVGISGDQIQVYGWYDVPIEGHINIGWMSWESLRQFRASSLSSPFCPWSLPWISMLIMMKQGQVNLQVDQEWQSVRLPRI